VKWSQRDNNNYEETGLLTSLHYFGENGKQFLRNFYAKSKRSIEKPKAEGPAAYVFTAADPRPGAQAELLRLLQAQGCEVSRATAAFTATEVRKKKPKKKEEEPAESAGPGGGAAKAPKETLPDRQGTAIGPITRSFPAGSYIVRMDQPYSRIADMMLDYQYWSPDDPQKRPYDDTGWTFGETFGVKVARVLDPKVLDVAMTRVEGEVRTPGELRGSGKVVAIAHTAEASLATLRYRFRDATFEAAEESFHAAGESFARGAFLVSGVDADALRAAASELGLKAVSLPSAPGVARHALRAPRIALVSAGCGLSSMAGGPRLDEAKILRLHQHPDGGGVHRPDPDTVLLFRRSNAGQAIVASLPMWGNPPGRHDADQTSGKETRPTTCGFSRRPPEAARFRGSRRSSGVMDTADSRTRPGQRGSTRPGRRHGINAAQDQDRRSLRYTASRGARHLLLRRPDLQRQQPRERAPPRRRREERPTGRGTGDPDRPPAAPSSSRRRSRRTSPGRRCP
jgi:hypothetical protein